MILLSSDCGSLPLSGARIVVLAGLCSCSGPLFLFLLAWRWLFCFVSSSLFFLLLSLSHSCAVSLSDCFGSGVSGMIGQALGSEGVGEWSSALLGHSLLGRGRSGFLPGLLSWGHHSLLPVLTSSGLLAVPSPLLCVFSFLSPLFPW